ncbi:DNA-J related domain-containing protein [Pleionea sp. CnH1-48]|uniref:DNA-J related domain-containing protein n=1 Tax=Pleionea sp. CnH1-48 TaxID=2954494 RepID=UPI0020978237|nr:DNA-J related domain-containing protein [Pleionea sp. CnH1-48]MCO7224847.1 DnaJ domain-containing protein [Pleionea sp. CnH1-48]
MSQLSEPQHQLLTLLEHSSPLSEYELFKQIAEHYSDFFAHLPDPDRLYEKHFWLFHQLYQLKHHLAGQQNLDITPLSIQLLPVNDAAQKVALYDPLADFYLDIENLYLSQEAVNAMQKKFWQRYLAIQNKAEAIQQLHLQDSAPLTLEKIKAAYKRLVHEHHPDKGGQRETFDKIHQAYNELKSLFAT